MRKLFIAIFTCGIAILLKLLILNKLWMTYKISLKFGLLATFTTKFYTNDLLNSPIMIKIITTMDAMLIIGAIGITVTTIIKMGKTSQNEHISSTKWSSGEEVKEHRKLDQSTKVANNDSLFDA